MSQAMARHRPLLYIAVVFIAVSACGLWPSLASARQPDPCDVTAPESTCVAAKEGSISVDLSDHRAEEKDSVNPTPTGSGDNPAVDPLVASCLDARAEAVARGVAVPPQIEALCGGTPTPAVTADLVLRAFRELPLYRGAIHADPRAWTLVNLDTYFWCANAAGQSCAAIGNGEQTVILLGRKVRVRPRIVSYTWSFGDGGEETVTGGGRVRHVYREPGRATVRVTLTWTAEFAVEGQPFQPIAGTTTTTSPALVLPVRQARPVLVGGG
jgi:hypothetical protein